MKTFLLTLAALSVLMPHRAQATVIMYGGNGGHTNGDSVNDGWLVTIDQTTGGVTPIANPANVSRITGIAFDMTGRLFVTTQGPGGFPPPPGPTTSSTLLELNPVTGAIINTIGLVRDTTGTPISIADLAAQPRTGVLYGIRGPQDQLGGQGKLYTINKSTGVATLVGSTGDFFGSIAFAPNGALYMSAADLDSMGNFINIGLKRLNPANAAVLSFVPTNDFFGALGIRPTDGVIFGGTGDSHQIFTVNPITGAETLIGDTGRNFVGDIDFAAPIYEYDFYAAGTTTVASSFRFPGFVRDVSPASYPIPGFGGFIPPSFASLVPCDLTSNSSAELDCRPPTVHGGIFYFVFDYGAFPSKLGPFTGGGFTAPDGATPGLGTVNLLNGQVIQVLP
jgi:hypothetical protein